MGQDLIHYKVFVGWLTGPGSKLIRHSTGRVQVSRYVWYI